MSPKPTGHAVRTTTGPSQTSGVPNLEHRSKRRMVGVPARHLMPIISQPHLSRRYLLYRPAKSHKSLAFQRAKFSTR